MQTTSAYRLNEVIKALRFIHHEVVESMPEREDVAELLKETTTEIGSILEED